ncbi:hypothetical protein A2U01_0054737, partial [Trifolium medium]|nr:hypothetical protein [Trifolium medium]
MPSPLPPPEHNKRQRKGVEKYTPSISHVA